MRLLIATFGFGQLAAASTTLWNGLQSVFISANITTACDAAFNTSLNCPETVLQYLPSSIQAVGWNTSTLTSMCTSECEASLGDLADAVATACGNDLRLPMGGQSISYEEIVDLIQYKFGLVCLADESTGEFCSDVEAGWNITEMVLLEEATWPTYTNKCYYTANGGDWLPLVDYDNSCLNPFDHSVIYTSVDNLVSLGGAKTAIEYYKELPDPIDDDNYGWSEPLDFDEYPLEIQCSSCFLSRFEYGLTNQWGDAWDEITEQVWANMKLNCDLDKTISPAINLTGSGIINGSFNYEITPVSTSCPQNLTIGATRMTCQEVAVSFGVPLSGILGLNNAISCAGVQNQDLCSPLSCPIGVVNSSVIPVIYDNLVDVAVYVKQFANITMTQFKTWNPYLFSNTLKNGEAVCVGPEGGAYVPPTATAAVPSVYTTTATPSNPTPTGTIDNCGLYYTVQSGDYCDLLCLQFSLTFSDFINMNPSIDSACSNLLLGDDYWNFSVAPVNGTTVPAVTTTMSPSGSSSSSTATMATSQTSTSSTATYATPPAATVSGTTAECEQWYVVQSGDTCSTIDAQYGITLEEFRAWNTYVDSACDNIWPDYAYCVDGPALSATSTAAATSTTTTSTGVVTPTPTQAGMVSGCTEFYEAQTGDGCYDIATSYGITLDEFIEWNPALFK
ncbi:hypothetical protein PFICI_11882 [Pestalotiopsis fici W106-1]|uniref:LysM domain-containing protein n=1 Tax=Pestalotiopsis fici (strain W106-1 / CGMCC3.15140) TaxID=1229662 RepID=W3WRK2_PESFW|nr:uncharacterized protein PFICI_11882 [Pestalotiopsis fici W106-1]ETS76495.1 hypothetical protein PFICI_11882 [Pestalotiopsis fici W106-1]